MLLKFGQGSAVVGWCQPDIQKLDRWHDVHRSRDGSIEDGFRE